MKKVFVIIVTYKGKQWYDRCFGSLRQSTIPVQTVVVDNSPRDEDADYIRTHFPEVYIIKTNENLGFGKANNLAMRYALDNGCDYVFLLNQDTWLIKDDTIEQLVKIAESHPEYGILSPMHVMTDEKTLNMDYEYKQGLCSRQLAKDLYSGSLQDVYETDYVNAAAWLLPRKTMETIGGFDPIFKHYEEDDNYLNRTIYNNLKIGICPSARIVHDHQDTPLSDERLLLRQQQNLLVEWTDINHAYSLWKEMRYCLRKWISSVFQCKFDKASSYRLRLMYCAQMNKAIKNSRKENLQKKGSWL